MKHKLDAESEPFRLLLEESIRSQNFPADLILTEDARAPSGTAPYRSLPQRVRERYSMLAVEAIRVYARECLVEVFRPHVGKLHWLDLLRVCGMDIDLQEEELEELAAEEVRIPAQELDVAVAATLAPAGPSKAPALRVLQREDPWRDVEDFVLAPLMLRFEAAHQCAHVPSASRFKNPAPHSTCTRAPLPRNAPRVVFILGSGTSSALQLPDWDGAALRTQLIDAAEEVYGAFVKEAWGLLRDKINLPDRTWDEARKKHELIARASTDQICEVAGKWSGVSDVMRKTIARAFTSPNSAGHAPTIGLELVAHMLKHGFVDHLITFRPDTALDETIRTELIDNFCILDSDAAEVSDVDVPHIIKMRGSASSPERVRAVHGTESAVTPDLLTLLDRIVFPEDDERPVHLICLDFAWISPKFTSWVHGYKDRIASVFSLVESIGKAGLDIECHAARTPSELTASSDVELGADSFLWVLWEQLIQRLRPYRVPVAARHFILGHLFGPVLGINGRPTEQANNRHERAERLGAELLLHTIKNKGMVPLRTIATNPRILNFGEGLTAGYKKNLVASLLPPSQLPEGQETLFCSARDARAFSDLFADKLGLVGRPVCRPRLDGGNRIRLTQEPWPAFLKEQVQNILENSVIEVLPQEDPFNHWILGSTIPIRSLTTLEERSRQLLESDWTCVFAVSELGTWLLKEIDHKPANRDVFVIRASVPSRTEWPYLDNVLQREANKDIQLLRTSTNTSIHLAELQWWKHNRHMTLVCTSTGFLGGILMRRELKDMQVHPVYVHDPMDCTQLLLSFLRYARRVARQQLHPLPAGLPDSPASTGDFVENVVLAVRRALPWVPETLCPAVNAAIESLERQRRELAAKDRILDSLSSMDATSKETVERLLPGIGQYFQGALLARADKLGRRQFGA